MWVHVSHRMWVNMMHSYTMGQKGVGRYLQGAFTRLHGVGEVDEGSDEDRRQGGPVEGALALGAVFEGHYSGGDKREGQREYV